MRVIFIAGALDLVFTRGFGIKKTILPSAGRVYIDFRLVSVNYYVFVTF